MKIFVSKRADRDFQNILGYLEYRWGANSVEKFKSLTNDFLDILESFPEIGSVELPEKKSGDFNSQGKLVSFIRSSQSSF